MEANTHKNHKEQDIYYFCKLITCLHWKHIEKEMEEIPQGVCNFCLKKDIQKGKIRHVKKELFFWELQKNELGIIDILMEILKIRCKMWWLQADVIPMEQILKSGSGSRRQQLYSYSNCK